MILVNSYNFYSIKPTAVATIQTAVQNFKKQEAILSLIKDAPADAVSQTTRTIATHLHAFLENVEEVFNHVQQNADSSQEITDTASFMRHLSEVDRSGAQRNKNNTFGVQKKTLDDLLKNIGISSATKRWIIIKAITKTRSNDNHLLMRERRLDIFKAIEQLMTWKPKNDHQYDQLLVSVLKDKNSCVRHAPYADELENATNNINQLTLNANFNAENFIASLEVLRAEAAAAKAAGTEKETAEAEEALVARIATEAASKAAAPAPTSSSTSNGSEPEQSDRTNDRGSLSLSTSELVLNNGSMLDASTQVGSVSDPSPVDSTTPNSPLSRSISMESLSEIDRSSRGSPETVQDNGALENIAVSKPILSLPMPSSVASTNTEQPSPKTYDNQNHQDKTKISRFLSLFSYSSSPGAADHQSSTGGVSKDSETWDNVLLEHCKTRTRSDATIDGTELSTEFDASALFCDINQTKEFPTTDSEQDESSEVNNEWREVFGNS